MLNRPYDILQETMQSDDRLLMAVVSRDGYKVDGLSVK
jgi:hypothetical protein